MYLEMNLSNAFLTNRQLEIWGHLTKKITKAEIIIHQQHFSLPVSLEDRSKMKYEVLIGRDLLEKSFFLIDPRKNIKEKI
jgi:hypothetical protein